MALQDIAPVLASAKVHLKALSWSLSNVFLHVLDILESEVLPEVLQVILTIGNFLNGVSSIFTICFVLFLLGCLLVVLWLFLPLSVQHDNIRFCKHAELAIHVVLQ